MDVAAKAKRSQALIDSIEELIALERDVSLATESCGQRRSQVMVPLTEVAFMPGTVASESVMVGLGQDYYVERTPREAQAVLQRRISDLSEQAQVLAQGPLLIPPQPPVQPPQQTAKPHRRKMQGGPHSKMTWAKGFLSTAQTSPKDGNAPAKAHEDKTGDDEPAPTPAEHVVELEDGENAPPIMEIREWLDESGNQISVDVTDLGKVLRAAPKAAAKARPHPIAGTDAKKNVSASDRAAAPSSVEPNAGSGRSSSDLESVFARLEEEEERAEKQAASPSLGPQWKKGFLDGGEKRPARPPSATTPGARGKPPAVGSAVPSSNIDEVAPSKAHAFRETVVEKPNLVGPVRSVLDSKPAIATATAGAPARVSRFKARRQGL